MKKMMVMNLHMMMKMILNQTTIFFKRWLLHQRQKSAAWVGVRISSRRPRLIRMSGFSFRCNLIPTTLILQIIQIIFWQKCAIRTKDNLSKERQKALQNAQIDHPEQAEEYMHEYSPWWCAPTIWAGMCEQWKAESWVKRCRIAAVNRASGAPEGNKAPCTYKGGNISQLQHVVAREASSQGQPIHWLDVYVATRDGLPEAVQIFENYKKLMDERYPEGIPRLPIDQELWERASVIKKNYVKGQGQRRRPTISGTGSSSSKSTQTLCHPMSHTAADCVRAICRDRDLLRTLRVHLQSLELDELAVAVATAARTAGD